MRASCRYLWLKVPLQCTYHVRVDYWGHSSKCLYRVSTLSWVDLQYVQQRHLLMMPRVQIFMPIFMPVSNACPAIFLAVCMGPEGATWLLLVLFYLLRPSLRLRRRLNNLFPPGTSGHLDCFIQIWITRHPRSLLLKWDQPAIGMTIISWVIELTLAGWWLGWLNKTSCTRGIHVSRWSKI